MPDLFSGIDLLVNIVKFVFNFANKTKNEKGEDVDLNDLTIKESTILYLYFNEGINRFISYEKVFVAWKDEVHSLCDRKVLKFSCHKNMDDYYTLTPQALATINKRGIKKRLIKPVKYRLYKKPKRKRIA